MIYYYWKLNNKYRIIINIEIINIENKKMNRKTI